MKKRDFLFSSVCLGALPATSLQAAKPVAAEPVLLTISGAITRHNRAAFNPAIDQLMAKHGIQFERALALTAADLRRMPALQIKPTLEYDSKVHSLSGPLLTTVLEAAGVALRGAMSINLRALDGYNVTLSLADVQAYRMLVATHIDGQPMALGGLGPQWAVYDADRLAAFKDKPVNQRFAQCPWGLYHIEVKLA